jgi:hypothetical protein
LAPRSRTQLANWLDASTKRTDAAQEALLTAAPVPEAELADGDPAVLLLPFATFR